MNHPTPHPPRPKNLVQFINDNISNLNGNAKHFIDEISSEHRVEVLPERKGVLFVNDSKATNINATWYTLSIMERPLVWLCGGHRSEVQDWAMLNCLVREKVNFIIGIGKDNGALKNIFHQIVESSTMRDAVNKAYCVAKKGDCILLSPGCASFDLYKNYEDRGREFKKWVDVL